MASFLLKVQRPSADVGLKPNRTKCSILTVDRAETLAVHFDAIPDMEREDNVIYLGARIPNNGCSGMEIQRRPGMDKITISKGFRIWKETKKYLMRTLIFPIRDIRLRIIDYQCILPQENRIVQENYASSIGQPAGKTHRYQKKINMQ